MTTDPVWGMKVDEKNHQYQPQFAREEMRLLLGGLQEGIRQATGRVR
jgi:hypothetical protein